MINGNLEQFLDTGWFNEATLFYKGYIYWCEAQFDEKKQTNFFLLTSGKPKMKITFTTIPFSSRIIL